MLRIALALVNDEANNDHLSVIRVMAYENRIPEKDEFKEAFQPKLYHGTVAALFRILRPGASGNHFSSTRQLPSRSLYAPDRLSVFHRRARLVGEHAIPIIRNLGFESAAHWYQCAGYE